MARRRSGIEWFPRHFKKRGAPSAAVTATPLLRLGRAPQGRRTGETAGNPTVRFDPQPSPQLANGRPPQRRHRGSTDQGNTARAVPAASARTEQGAKRMTGLVTRDSAQRRPIDKHRLDARNFLTISPTACPPTRPTGCRRAMCLIVLIRRPIPDPAAAGRPLRRLHENPPLRGPIRAGFTPGTRPTVASFPKTRPKVSNQATEASVTAFEIARQDH